MKIVSVTYVNAREYSWPEDWIRFIKPYVGVLEELAKCHTVICLEQINYKGQYAKAGIQYEFLNYGQRINRFPFSLHRFIKNLNPDIVFVRGLHFPYQVILLRRALNPEVRIIAQHHAGNPTGWIRKILLRKADRAIDDYLFSDSNSAKEWVKNGIIRNKNKIHQIGMLSSFFHPIERNKARLVTSVLGSPVYLWVGQLTANKDPLTVVNAFFEFLKFQPLAKLYIIYQGTGSAGELETILKKRIGAMDSVMMIGKVPHEQLLNWYNSADFFISGSHAESYGVALTEAMSCGCIPIVTNIPSFSRMTKEGACGLLYKPGDKKALLSALMKSLELNSEEEHSRVLKQFADELSIAAISKKINGMLAPAHVNS